MRSTDPFGVRNAEKPEYFPTLPHDADSWLIDVKFSIPPAAPDDDYFLVRDAAAEGERAAPVGGSCQVALFLLFSGVLPVRHKRCYVFLGRCKPLI